jgi:hypothetical protein
MLTVKSNSTAKTVLTTIAELFFLGAYGYLFNSACNWAYEKFMGTKAELPMRIGFVFVYYIAIVVPVTIGLVGYLEELIDSPEVLSALRSLSN